MHRMHRITGPSRAVSSILDIHHPLRGYPIPVNSSGAAESLAVAFRSGRAAGGFAEGQAVFQGGESGSASDYQDFVIASASGEDRARGVPLERPRHGLRQQRHRRLPAEAEAKEIAVE